MVTKVFDFMKACWSWMPWEILGMLSLAVAIKFGDSILGLWDRTMRVIGR